MLCIGYNELIVAGYDHHHLLPQKRHFAPFFYGRVIGGMPACREVKHACMLMVAWRNIHYTLLFCVIINVLPLRPLFQLC